MTNFGENNFRIFGFEDKDSWPRNEIGIYL